MTEQFTQEPVESPSTFVYVRKDTGAIVCTAERDVVRIDNTYTIKLSDVPFFANWWDYKVVEGRVVPKTAGEPRTELDAAKLVGLRAQRNILLAETDWWVLPDRTPTAAQLAYRQALRDITNIYKSLDEVVWPTKPE